MNAIIKGKVFKSGNSAAVRLPKELGFEQGSAVTLERIGSDLRMRPLVDPEEGKRRLRAMIAALEALPVLGERWEREPFEAPERSGWGLDGDPD